MKFKLALCLLCLWAGKAFSQNFLPTAYPDRVILSWNGDPKTTQGISWRTDAHKNSGFIEYQKADASPDFEQVRQLKATSTFTEIDGVKAHFHEVSLAQLEPNTLYTYRVGHDKAWSEWFQFRTGLPKGTPFSFLFFGDAQNDLKSRWSRVIRQAYRMVPESKFMVHAGDLINRTHNDSEWGEWHYAGGFIHAMVPSLPTPGNHEYDRDYQRNLRLDFHWQANFNLPLNGPEGLKESVYYTDYADCRLISLNSQMIVLEPELREKQAVWLEKVLRENTQKWTIVFFHHPIFSSKEGRDNPNFRARFKPLFEKYGVDLVLQGHDHTYGRGTELPRDGQSPNKTSQGPMYVVSVAGPKMYNLALNKWMDRAASNTQLFQKISIDGDALDFESFLVTGQRYDAFRLKKTAKGLKIVDMAPKEMQERLDLPKSYLNKLSPEEIKAYYKVYPKTQ